MSDTVYAFLSGLGIALSFILAIGAQNAFILKQGLKKQHVFGACLTCAISDTILIIAGVIAHQEFSAVFPKLRIWLQYLGATFLILYSIKSFYNAFAASHSIEKYFSISDEAREKQIDKRHSLISTILIALAFTWLNPHVYLDTLIVIGSLSLKFPDTIISYTLGAVMASYLFFFSLGYGARILTPWFQNSWSWKILDGLIGVVMFILGWALLNKIF